MDTKGIRQAENESPYTVKTTGATWWKEDAFSCFQRLGEEPADLPESQPLTSVSSEQHLPPSIQPQSQLKTGPC